MIIRKATLEDTDSLIPLYNGSLRNMAQLQPLQYQEVPQDVEFVQQGILSEDGDVLVAEDAGKIIGLASVFVQETKPYPFRVQHKWCDLDTLYVDENHRRKGVGTALFQAAWQWAMQRELSSLQLMTLGENANAQRFYERMGMKELRLMYILEP